MRKITAFVFITLDGYYKGAGEDISWHPHDEEGNQYAAEMVKLGNILLFGRKTYDFMASYWPTDMALQNDPEVAKGMNSAEKIVFSKTLKNPDWHKTTVISSNMVEELARLKQLPGKDMTLLGSGAILTQLADAGLIDEYQLMVDPVAIGEGTSIFKGLKQPLNLKLTSSRNFKNGAMLHTYQRMSDLTMSDV